MGSRAGGDGLENAPQRPKVGQWMACLQCVAGLRPFQDFFKAGLQRKYLGVGFSAGSVSPIKPAKVAGRVQRSMGHRRCLAAFTAVQEDTMMAKTSRDER